MSNRKYKKLTTLVSADDACPDDLRHLWQGGLFFYSKKYGMCDIVRLTKMLGCKYASATKNILEFQGSFTLITNK